MDDLETKKLRDSLVEYEGYLREMRQVTLKKVETLDAIQRYTDKSAAGMQKLAEQSLDGIQKVTAESAGGLRRIIETGSSNLSRMADAGEENLNRTAQECLTRLKGGTEAALSQIEAAREKNLETAAAVEKIEGAILEHMESMKELLKQSDDFTHRENVKVYRNVQAVVVDEVKKQIDAMAAQKDELASQNETLRRQNRGLRPLLIVTLLAAVANIALLVCQIAGVF